MGSFVSDIELAEMEVCMEAWQIKDIERRRREREERERPRIQIPLPEPLPRRESEAPQEPSDRGVWIIDIMG